MDARSYVALLKELCEEYRLGEPDYELVGDTGPPHQRHFTMRASLGLHERHATSTTKKAARQLAAEQLYTYLRENLARLTGDFVEVINNYNYFTLQYIQYLLCFNKSIIICYDAAIHAGLCLNFVPMHFFVYY